MNSALNPKTRTRPTPLQSAGCAAAAFLGALSLAWYPGSALIFTGKSVLHLLYFAALWWLFRFAWPGAPRRLFALTLGGGLVLGACFAAGAVVDIGASFLHMVVLAPGYGFIFAAALCVLFSLASRRRAPLRAGGARGRLAAFFARLLSGEKRATLRLFGILLLCWLPVLVLCWPGLISVDVTHQLEMWFGSQPFTTHHPPLHTAFLGLFAQLGRAVFGSLYAGIAMAALLQWAGTAAVVCHSLAVMGRAGVRLGFRVAALLFFALVPFASWYSLTLWKDVWLASFTLLFFLRAAEITRHRAAFFARGASWAGLAFASLGLLFSKNNGLYFFAITLVVMLAALRGCRRQLAAVLAAGLVVYAVVSGPVYAAAGIKKGDAREALSLPLMQIARVVLADEASISAEDKALINTVLPYAQLASRYDPRVSDAIKAEFDTATFRQNPGRYAALWLRLGLASPRNYVLATLEQTYGYWYPDTQHWIFAYNTYPAELAAQQNNLGGQETRLGEYADPFAGARAAFVYGVAMARKVPVLSMLFSIGFYFWLLLACCLYLVYQKRWTGLVPMTLLFVVWLTCLASPVFAEFRYAWPAIICVPAALGFTFGAKRPVPDEAPDETVGPPAQNAAAPQMETPL